MEHCLKTLCISSLLCHNVNIHHAPEGWITEEEAAGIVPDLLAILSFKEQCNRLGDGTNLVQQMWCRKFSLKSYSRETCPGEIRLDNWSDGMQITLFLTKWCDCGSQCQVMMDLLRSYEFHVNWNAIFCAWAGIKVSCKHRRQQSVVSMYSKSSSFGN